MHFSKALWLSALALFFLPNALADAPSPEEERLAKSYGFTPEEFHAVIKRNEELTPDTLAFKSPEGASRVQALLREAISNIDASSKPMVTKGNNLPASFTDLFFPKQRNVNSTPPFAAVLTSGFMGLKADNCLDQFTILWSMGLINTAPEILVPVLRERAEVFPPSAADYILFACVREGIKIGRAHV